MLIPWKASPSPDHETLFLERYGRIRGWLLQLTDHDYELTEDLLHDAFIQFTFTRPDISTIQNLDGYLYSLTRNLHISQLRRTAHSRFEQLSIIDYDSSEIGMRMIDLRDQIQVQDELRRVCYYACVRKETAWMASVLILRFFHGYYPSEIALVLRNSRQSVDVLLRCARREAKAYLENPRALSFMKERSTPAPTAPTAKPNLAPATDALLDELRSMILSFKGGDCLSRKQLQKVYRTNSSEQIRCEDLAHFVSCEKCLDEINESLGLPPLSARYPTASLGKKSRAKSDDDDDSQCGAGGGMLGEANTKSAGKETSRREFMRTNQRRSRETFEHRPQELHIAVNGYTLGSQRINSKLSEQTLDINLPEQINFIEVFSEQKIRLLFANVDAPPGGPLKQPVRVDLSDGRTLELLLRFRSPWPMLHVAYHDPSFSDVADATSVEQQVVTSISQQQHSQDSSNGSHETSLLKRFSSIFKKSRWLSDPATWLRPGTVSSVFAVALIVALLIFQTRISPPTVSAAELLRQSAVAEVATSDNPHTVLHRTLDVEERSVTGDVLARRRVEVWHSAEKGITARRLYDERNQLIAGEWSKTADGSRTSYRRGDIPQDKPSTQKLVAAPQSLDDAWQLEPSAKKFALLIVQTDRAHVEELPTAYVITYASELADNAHGLVKTKLTLGRSDLRPTEQTLLVRQAKGVMREYRYVEAGFEKQPATAVAASVFTPEPELLNFVSATSAKKTEVSAPAALPVSSPISTATTTSAITEASAQLEVEVLNLLTGAGADLGEEVSVRRMAGVPLQIEAVVVTEQRRQDILEALKPVVRNPAVKVKIETAAEVVKRSQQASQSTGTMIFRTMEPTGDTIPVDAEVRRHFLNKAISNERINGEVNRFANRTLKSSQQAVLHVWALRALVKRFSVEELRTLDKGAQVKWLEMIRKHAQEFEHETATLRGDLSPVFNIGQKAGGVQDETEILDEAGLVRAITRLVELGSANDAAIRSSFNISAATSASSAVKTPQFWHSLSAAEHLAAKIQSATHRLRN